MPVMASTGGMVQLGVVEAIEEMNAAGAGGGDADANPAGEFGIRTRHERGGFFVADMDEADAVFVLAQGFEDAVDAVAGESEDGVNAPGDEALY